ncbi:SPOR domain-containing protein [Duncaniella freteri]|uniref:SPOR domain-containing protein n=1 Tax=Duncaniella freteri TaxID=2530391 RepID=UPI0025894B25|nr:SPOR domain-containing protein [Duncaniella freteri]
MRLLPIALCLTVISAATVRAEETAVAVTIVDHITAGTSNVINQPEALLKRLMPIVDSDNEESTHDEHSRPIGGRMAGYRVQVFSDNNVRTAKAEAGSKQRIISARFPQYQTYVRYTSPYWRLKVGDFRTQQEANDAADELRKAFPAYSKEIRVVRDRISLPND